MQFCVIIFCTLLGDSSVLIYCLVLEILELFFLIDAMLIA